MTGEAAPLLGAVFLFTYALFFFLARRSRRPVPWIVPPFVAAKLMVSLFSLLVENAPPTTALSLRRKQAGCQY